MDSDSYLVIWFHDECIFYAHDHHIICWVHSSETAKPYAKGEGESLMVADFVLADYGFLSSPEGCGSVRVELKPGKNHDSVGGNSLYRTHHWFLTHFQGLHNTCSTHFIFIYTYFHSASFPACAVTSVSLVTCDLPGFICVNVKFWQYLVPQFHKFLTTSQATPHNMEIGRAHV